MLPATLPNTSGIYCIRNSVNNKRYVGSAKNLASRYRAHKCDLRKGRHHSPYLQNSWLKHGSDIFEFVVLETCAVEELIPREQYWIDSLRPEYNILPNAGSNFGYRWSEEQKRRIAEARGLELFEYKGERRTLSEIARLENMSVHKLWRRVVKQGMSVEAAINLTNEEVFRLGALKNWAGRSEASLRELSVKLSKAQSGKVVESRRKKYEYLGRLVSLYDLADELGLNFKRLYSRVHAGVPLEEAVRLNDCDDIREEESRYRAWYERTVAARAAVGYVPMSEEGRAKQRAAVVEYNKTREVTDEMRKKMSAAHRKHPRVQRFEYEGELMTVTDMAERFGICRHVLRKRINAGWSIHEAVTTPTRKKK